MTPRELDESYHRQKSLFHDYITRIKQNAPWDIFTIINPTLIKNPYASSFPKSFFGHTESTQYKTFLFPISILKYYAKNFYLFNTYIIAFALYKIYYKKKRKNSISTVIDTFGLIDKTNHDGEFKEHYLPNIYDVFEKHDKPYTILIRLYGMGRNPLKLKRFFEIINRDKRDFLFEFEFLSFYNFIELLILILQYPFKTFRLRQNATTSIDTLFNQSLYKDLEHTSFNAFTRYLCGKNITHVDSVETIYSWSEFQVIERSFNFAVRTGNSNIKLIACQFFLNYETYFNAYVDDLDYEMQSSPHEVLVNGKYYILECQKVLYRNGVSLRYKSIFTFSGIQEEKNLLILGSYLIDETKNILSSVQNFKHILFKCHPASDLSALGKLSDNIIVSNENIYTLFEKAKLVLATASGTALEAVACGISVIIVASQNNLTANPLVEYGKGEIWDIAYTQDEVQIHYNRLLHYREENHIRLQEIAQWYKNNFFIEPTEENILNTFHIKTYN